MTVFSFQIKSRTSQKTWNRLRALKLCAIYPQADWSWPTRLAPLLHEIMFCWVLTYVMGGAILGTINMFSQWRQNVKSLYFKVLTLSCLLPPTFQFTMIMPHIHTLMVYIFLTGLYASCFCTICPVHLVESGWKCGWERIWLVSM